MDRSFETQLSLAPPVLDCVNSHHRDLRGDGRLFCDRLCRGGQKVGRAVNFRAGPGMVGDPRSFLDVYDLSVRSELSAPPTERQSMSRLWTAIPMFIISAQSAAGTRLGDYAARE